jgi:LysR family transcriptional regulator, regulator for genes of the gallate degradation pathway
VLAVTRCGSAVQAAEALHLSVSAVTRAVQQAEQLLDVPLFDRGARGMVATPAAALLAPRIERALAELVQGQAQVSALARPAARAHAAQANWAHTVTDALLHTLGAVAETRSEGAAARSLGISQAAVHQQLRALEHAARVPLFERSHRGTRLTEAGEVMLRHAKVALAELRIGHEELAAFQGRAVSPVAVGALPMASTVLVPQALSRLFLAQPGLSASVSDGTYEALLQQLRHADIDLMVGPLRGALAPADVQEHVLFEDHMLAVVRPGHPSRLSGRAPALRALRAWPWIGPLPGTPAQIAFERVFAAAGLALPRVTLQAHSTAVLVAVLLASDAVALLSPWQVRAELDAGTLVSLPLRLQGTQRDIGVTLRRDGLPSPGALAFLRHLHAVATQDAHK